MQRPCLGQTLHYGRHKEPPSLHPDRVWNILKSVRFWVSSDDAVWNGNASDTAGWTPIEGIYTFTEDLDQREFVFDIPAAEGRYLKIEVVESARGGDVGTLAEIYGYGKEL